MLRLNSDLGIEQSVTLSSDAVNISLSSGGEWLVVCSADLSCAVHSANDLSTVSSTSGSALAAANRSSSIVVSDIAQFENSVMKLYHNYNTILRIIIVYSDRTLSYINTSTGALLNH